MTKSTKEIVSNPEVEQVDPEVVDFRAHFGDRSPLDEIVRDGARKMLQAAIDAEVEEFLGEHSARRDDAGRRLVVRNGHKRICLPVPGQGSGCSARLLRLPCRALEAPAHDQPH